MAGWQLAGGWHKGNLLLIQLSERGQGKVTMTRGPLVESLKRSSKTRNMYKTVGGEVEGEGVGTVWTGSAWVGGTG